MTCSNTNLVAVQAVALALLTIAAAATGRIIFPHPPPFAAAILPMASAAVRMGRVRSLAKEVEREARALFWDVMRAMRALDAEWGL
jgi:hypothetical protein